MMKKSLILKIIILAIIFITAYIVIDTIETKNFDLQFAVDKNESTINTEKVRFEGKLIKFPLNFYYIKGSLIIEDKSYLVNRYKKESRHSSLEKDSYYINVIDRDDPDFFYGYARLTGDITNDSVQSMYISISITQKNTGSTYGEYITCSIIK